MLDNIRNMCRVIFYFAFLMTKYRPDVLLCSVFSELNVFIIYTKVEV